MEKNHANKKKNKKKWWILTPIIILLILLVSIVGYGFHLYTEVKNNIDDNMHEQVSDHVIDTEKTKEKIENKDNINILLLGIDSESSVSGRSDAIIVMTLNPNEDKIQLVSIPRDTRVTIVGRGEEDKINHAHAFGGPDMAIETVESFLDIDIDYFARVNMDGMAELVDLVGPITVNNELAFSQGGDTFPLGDITLTGPETMNFVRMRKEDPRGDFGRTERQRKVIEGIVAEGAKIENITRISDLLDVLGDNVSTNMTFSDMTSLFQDYRQTASNFEDYQMQGSGTMINGIYYYIVTEDEINRVHDLIES
ncbi:cell envelope-related function transcriptional attenuator common domain-containing protein [Halolactibacillus halophilus]|uniref:Cell envelope-related function transcriptional attenuator common domain-containing protein n=1 Tax=Halolactibacillus halophilus TaxID=306540 RepID=A0A1I5Q7B4_9BACI|nr:LCP family protein [Halolactibacillus halophilus]GEM01625.1 transcriptional regulator LytR [Halolactibacillus halophilus]SFP41901.1 cell envelope-related function transcriptional attenuator common domain-containing protein [Halolactibacillus halophilus]